MLESQPEARRRLIEEPIGWLTTVSEAGVPSTAPVWFFLEDDESITIYSRDPSVRVRNLSANPHVTLHLEGDGRGGAILVVTGTATTERDAPSASAHKRYLSKYRPFLDAYGWTPEWFAARYPTAIRLTASAIRT